MRLGTICEDISYKDTTLTTRFIRSNKDRERVSRLDKLVNGGKGYKPPFNYITMIAEHDGELVGFVVVRPLAKAAYHRRSAVHPDYADNGIMPKLLEEIASELKRLGFEYVTARADTASSSRHKQFYGKPVSQIKYKHKTVDKFKKDLATEQRPTTRVATRSGPMYKHHA